MDETLLEEMTEDSVIIHWVFCSDSMLPYDRCFKVGNGEI